MSPASQDKGCPSNRRVSEPLAQRRAATLDRLDRLVAAVERCALAVAALPPDRDGTTRDATPSVLVGATPEERAVYDRVIAALTAPLEAPEDA
jgi:hypothetical protein